MSILPPDATEHTQARQPTSVYLYYDKYGALLYVGITSRGIARNIEHNRSKEWFRFVTRQEIEHHKSRGAALNRENELIRKYRPPFNTQNNPSHEHDREAYYLFRESPSFVRDEFLSRSRRPVAKGAAVPLPKTLWFRLRTSAEFLLAADVPLGTTFVTTTKLTVKNHARRVVGRLVSVDKYGLLLINFDDKSFTPEGICAGVRWPSTNPHRCQILNLVVPNSGGLRAN